MDLKGLNTLTAEALHLTNKAHLTKMEERRYAAVLAGISSIKAGATLQEVDYQNLNATEAENGLPITRIHKGLTAEQRSKALLMQEMFKGNCGGVAVKGGLEFRTGETGGVTKSQLGTYTGLSQFVPTDLYNVVKERLAEHDVLFDVDGPMTVISSTNARPLRVSMFNDTDVNAVQVGEGIAQGSVNLLQYPDSVTVGAYSYRTPVHPVSIETFQDLSEVFTFEQLFEKFASKRLARGIGAALMTGTGPSGTGIVGLIPSLEASAAVPVVAQGSGANDGVGTATNSLGSDDFANLIASVNKEYRESKSAGFVMNSSTFAAVAALKNKIGGLLHLVDFIDGQPTIYGQRVYISPSVPSIGALATPCLYGDLSYWITRLVPGGFRILKEAPGLIEQGNFGAQALMRADGALCIDTTSSTNVPINYLIQHS